MFLGNERRLEVSFFPLVCLDATKFVHCVVFKRGQQIILTITIQVDLGFAPPKSHKLGSLSYHALPESLKPRPPRKKAARRLLSVFN